MPEYTESACPAPEAIPNGKFTVYNNDYEMQEVPYFTTKFLYGYYILYSCNYGYRLVGVADVTCGYKGWLHSPPRCVPKDPTQGGSELEAMLIPFSQITLN